MNSEAIIDAGGRNVNILRSVSNLVVRNFSKVFYIAIAVILFLGWSHKENSNLSPETGFGYILGIVGGSLMLLLLLYPLRKKFRIMHRLGLVKHWFKMHMLFGVLGPVAIMFHANFSLGSINSNLAMFSMVVVASSGLIGRYLYAKIHHGLYGRKANLQELRKSLLLSKDKFEKHFSLSQDAVQIIKKTEKKALKNRNLIVATIIWPFIYLYVKYAKFKLKRLLYKDFSAFSESRHWDRKIVKQISRKAYRETAVYLDGLYSIFGFRIFENLFSLWHIFHLPLFFLLVITGIVHVIVVHGY